MSWLFLAVLATHALIHFMGFAKGFELADLPRLEEPVSRAAGALWLTAGTVLLVAAALFVFAPQLWWAVGFAGVALSQLAIVGSWRDAKFGTAVNATVLIAATYGLAAYGPWSHRAAYDQAIAARTSAPRAGPPITEADLAALPAPVQCYLRQAGVVGQPRVRQLAARWRGRIRGSADEPWMAFTAEQHSFVDEPARFFWMRASRGGLPVSVFHAFSAGAAAMEVRLLSLVPVVDLEGSEMTRAETVTLLNDWSILAPAVLVEPSVRWEPVDATSARATYTVGAHTVGAVLHFDEACALVDFVSDDRLRASADGTQLLAERWSTPLSEPRQFGPYRLASRGEGRWHPPDGDFAYLELELVDLRVGAGLTDGIWLGEVEPTARGAR